MTLSEAAKRDPKECWEKTPPELRHLYKDEDGEPITDPLYMWPLPPDGELVY